MGLDISSFSFIMRKDFHKPNVKLEIYHYRLLHSKGNGLYDMYLMNARDDFVGAYCV